jgi:hypothetical protein
VATEIPILIVSRNTPAVGTPSNATSDDVYTLVDNDGNVVVLVTNPTGEVYNVSVTTTATIAGMGLGPTVIVIPANKQVWIGPWPPVLYNDAEGDVTITDSEGFLQFSGLRF